MFQSQILSRLSRLALLSVFCAGLFITSGELSVNTSGVQIGSGGIQSVMAEDTTTKKDPTNDTINSIVSFLNLGIGVLTFLVTPLIMLAGWLLSPDWTFGEIFGLRPIIHQIWILISNVVYVIFGFMLVFVAFANIFGGEHAKTYEMKSMLPKLVTGMLIVPFTWFIVSAVLSVSNILTASVISLPVETILKAGGSTTGLLADKIIPKTIVFNKDVDYGTGAKEEVGNDNVGVDTNVIANGNFYASDCKTAPDSCLTIKEFLTNGGGGAYNLLSVYAYGIFRIQDYKAITTEQKINKIIDIASKLGFGVIFFIVFGILVIAIVYALLSRAFMLWLYAMFSPIFALTFVLGDKAKKLEKFTVKEFISLALVPVYVSAALAFGLMFLGLVMGATSQGTTGADGKLKSDVVDITTTKSTTTFAFGNADQGIKFTTIGLLTPEVKSGTSKALDLGKGVIGTIIMNILALVILWMAVMAALGASKITEAAVAPIKGFGDEIGKLAMKAPQYIPIPLPSKDGKSQSISMAGLGSVTGTVQGALTQMATTQGGSIGKTFAETLGLSVSDLTTALNGATGKLQSNQNQQAQKEVWRDIYSKIGDANTLNTNKEQIVPKFQEMLGAMTTIPEIKRKELGEILSKDPKKFIVELEKYMDANTSGFGGGLVDPDKGKEADTILKAVKVGNTTTATPRYTIDTDKKIHINIEGKKPEELTYKIDGKNLKAENGSNLTEALTSKGLKKPEIDEIIKKIKEEHPELSEE